MGTGADRILFCNPPWWDLDWSNAVDDTPSLRQGIRAGSRWPFTRPAAYAPDQFRFGSYMPFPFFLASAAAYVQQHKPDATVAIRDSIARGESYQSFINWFLDFSPTHIVIETGAASLEHDLKLLRMIRDKFPQMRLAVAGPVAATAAKTAEPGLVDAWLLGEYEKNALLFADGASGVLPFNMLTKDELGALPYPMFDEEAALHYWDGCPKGQTAPHLHLWASRGCVYKCCFCAWPATMTGNDPDGTSPRNVRHYPAAWLEGYIKSFIARHPETKCIYFDDDWFNNSKRHVLAVCEMMRHIGLPWFAMCRADTSDKETWIAMRDSGCRGVKVGFESGSQRVVDQIINKRLNVAEAIEWCRFIKSLGMTVHTTWTVNLPGETKEEQAETVALIERMYAEGLHDTHQLSGTAMIEGTPLALIESGAALAKYPGAKVDGGYQSSHDGVRKLEDLGKGLLK